LAIIGYEKGAPVTSNFSRYSLVMQTKKCSFCTTEFYLQYLIFRTRKDDLLQKLYGPRRTLVIGAQEDSETVGPAKSARRAQQRLHSSLAPLRSVPSDALALVSRRLTSREHRLSIYSKNELKELENTRMSIGFRVSQLCLSAVLWSYLLRNVSSTIGAACSRVGSSSLCSNTGEFCDFFVCVLCTAGYFCNDRKNRSPCGPGTFCVAGSSSATYCDYGTYNSGSFRSECDAIPSGT
jgi:hypothetical protein